MHPLAPDLTNLKDDELQTKQGELTRRLNQSYQSGNAQMVAQIQMLLQDYQDEIARRHQKNLEAMMSKNDKFKGIIDIK